MIDHNDLIVSDGVVALALEFKMRGQVGVIYPTLVWDNDIALLVDAGFPGSIKLLQEAVTKAGVPFERLKKVIITHQDPDHIGGLPDLVKETNGQIHVLSHAVEKPYIQGDRSSYNLSPAEISKVLETLPEEERQQMAHLFSNPPKAKVNQTVEDGEIVPDCGGITVIFTPGHTAGHISLYLNASKTLVAGDALIMVEGRLAGPQIRLQSDVETGLNSIKKLTRYDIQTVVCYHGGIARYNVNKRIAELASG